MRISIGDVTQDSLTVTWNNVGDFLYFLQLFDVAARRYKLAPGAGDSHTFSGLSADSEYEILLLVYSGDDSIDSDSTTVRTAA